MKNRQLFSIATLMLAVMTSVVASEHREDSFARNNLLSDMMATNLIKTLTGGYLIAKDIVHYQLGAHTPYAVLYNKNTFSVFSPTKHYVKDALRYGRYGFLGLGLLAYAACDAHNKKTAY